MTDQPCSVRQAAAALSVDPLNAPTCPVCQALALCLALPPPRGVRVGHAFLSVSCTKCGAFLIEEGFLAHGWDTIAPEEKHAIARALHATKESPGCRRELRAETWARWAQLGRRLETQCRPRRHRKGKHATGPLYRRSRQLWLARAWMN